LYGCADSETAPEIVKFFELNHPQGPDIQGLLLGHLYQMLGKADLAEATYDQVISQYPNTPLGVRAEIDDMLIALYMKDDLRTAKTILSKIETQADLITPMELRDAQVAVALHGGSVSANSEIPSAEVTAVKSSKTPKSIGLSQNYPNPFNPLTMITYQLPRDTHVTIEVYDVLGREVATLVDQDETAGIHEVSFDGSRFASGLYFYRMTTPTYSKVMQMLLVK